MSSRVLAALSAALLLGLGPSCGNPAPPSTPTDCATSKINGSWFLSSTSEVITLNSQCVYTSTACAVRGTVSLAAAASGTLTLSGLTTTQGGCSVTATKSCTYSLSVDGQSLTLDCTDESGATSGGTYAKQ